MSYSCVIYRNTGFNATNIPDSIALLNQFSHDSVPALEILQERNLNSIKIKAYWDQVKDVDYCVLNGNWVYAVVNVNMLNTDTAELSVIPDYINSTGGIRALNILDGITERVHVSNDGYGLYDEDDPLMTPMQPLQVQTAWHTPGNGSSTYVECTLDPKKTANSGKAKKYDVTGDSDAWVSVPEAVGNTVFTEFKIPGQSLNSSRGTTMFNMGDADVRSAVATLRSLGLEQAIVSQVKYPTSFVDISNYQFTGKEGHWSSSFSFNQHSGIKNNRINYANYEKYGIITCAGDNCEFEPAALNNGSSKPVIDYKSDPNPDGKPYFRYRTVNGNSEFWRNCLSGMPWKQVPLVFTGKSGSALDTARFQNQSEIAKEQQQVKQDMNAINMGTQTISSMGQMLSGEIAGALTGFGGNMLGGVLTNAQNTMNYEHQRRSELLDFQISQNIVVPTVNFPYNSDGIRDLKNNGILEYRYKLTDFDTARIDKLLTMYGYKYTKALEASDFTNRRYFNFVMAKDISVTGHAAWINDGIAEQLKTGVRVWHVAPNKSYYTNNPIA